MNGFEMMRRQTDLPDIVGTLRPPGRFAHHLDRRNQHPDQNPDDGNDHQQLHQRETRLPARPVRPQRILSLLNASTKIGRTVGMPRLRFKFRQRDCLVYQFQRFACMFDVRLRSPGPKIAGLSHVAQANR